MQDEAPATTLDVNQRIAQRVRDLRTARGDSLEALATRCGVSRSMISLVERGESSPTATVLDKLAAGLGVPLATLFSGTPTPDAPPSPVARAADQSVWTDPASGYVRRALTPPGCDGATQLVEVTLPGRTSVAFEHVPRAARVTQQVWVLDGRIDVTVGVTTHALRAGDCLAMDLDGPTSFSNPKRKAARYLVVVTTEPRRS